MLNYLPFNYYFNILLKYNLLKRLSILYYIINLYLLPRLIIVKLLINKQVRVLKKSNLYPLLKKLSLTRVSLIAIILAHIKCKASFEFSSV
jgi:hypothetical protein